MTLEFLQNYWWLLISILGGLLVFLLFVQGGQSLLLEVPQEKWRQIVIDSVGRKWELTYTTLVLFGGAAFASFPLFYSTSFGGAYWLWILILFTFVVQAVSYEYRRKPGNLLGTRVYDVFLFINGTIGCFLLGDAVGSFFFGADFTVGRTNLLNGASPVISTWGNSTHGLELIFHWPAYLLGFSVYALARVLGILYIFNSSDIEKEFRVWLMGRLKGTVICFLIFFLTFLVFLFIHDGYRVVSDSGYKCEVVVEKYLYLHNLLAEPATLVLFILGVGNVLLGVFSTWFRKGYNQGIWFAGIGTVFTVVALFWLAGYNATPFFPSNSDPASSLTIHNASSSEFTLKTMSWVSILIPFVLGYIFYVWRKIDKTKVS